MNKRLRMMGVVAMLLLALAACSPEENEVAGDVETPAVTEAAIEQPAETPAEPEAEEVVPEAEPLEMATSKINGTQIPKTAVDLRPFAVMLDNHTGARPQAGLDQADLIYEILAEGGITRYMAIFQSQSPESIGPVRSARPYFIDKALEFEAMYVHDGGSPQAFADIVNLNVADISAQSRGGNIFWRKNHKKAPHNEYTNAEAVRLAARQSGFRKKVDFETWSFKAADEDIEGKVVTKFEIPFDKGYKSRFIYNDEDKIYLRESNGKPHTDEVSDIQLSFKNIIVQKAKTKVIDSAGRLKIETVSSGDGYYITNGDMIEIKWKKASRTGLTKFYNKDGTVLEMNPGKIWITVMPADMTLDVLNEG